MNVAVRCRAHRRVLLGLGVLPAQGQDAGVVIEGHLDLVRGQAWGVGGEQSGCGGVPCLTATYLNLIRGQE